MRLPMDPIGLLIGNEQAWHDIKTFVEHSIGFSHDALHVLIGPPIQFIAAALLRTSVRDFRPVLVLLVLETLNEWHDLRVEEWPDWSMQWGEGAKDMLLTLALPVLILILARWQPGLFGGSKVKDGGAGVSVQSDRNSSES